MQHGITVLPTLRDTALPAGSGDRPSPFGVLFEREPDQPDDFVLGLLGRSGGAMQDTARVAQTADRDAPIPAGFTFFGQFLDHEITLMSLPPTLGQPQDLDTVVNLRTPKLDLDTVFGKGPADPDSAKFYDPTTLKLRLAATGRDIVRADDGATQATRLIPDSRNDQTVILVQLHVLFMKLYNRFIDEIGGRPQDIHRHTQARKLTVQHFQHLVLTDYLPRIVGQEAVDAARARGASRYAAMVERFPLKLIIPVEFSFAAFRFGHSQLRDTYRMNELTVRLLFSGEPTPGLPTIDLSGNQPVTLELIIDWNFFFEVAELDNRAPPANRNVSRKFDTFVSPSMLRLRPPAITNLPVSLAERNLRRGRAFKLPSGQSIARALSIAAVGDLNIPSEVIAAQEALRADDPQLVDIRERTPLWYYVLREAELTGGNRLAGVGAWIVAETIVGLLLNDPEFDP